MNKSFRQIQTYITVTLFIYSLLAIFSGHLATALASEKRAVAFKLNKSTVLSLAVPASWKTNIGLNNETQDAEIQVSSQYIEKEMTVTISPVLSQKIPLRKVSMSNTQVKKHESALERLILIGELSLKFAKQDKLKLNTFANNSGHLFILTSNQPTDFKHFGYGVLTIAHENKSLELFFSYKSNSNQVNNEIQQLIDSLQTTQLNTINQEQI